MAGLTISEIFFWASLAHKKRFANSESALTLGRTLFCFLFSVSLENFGLPSSGLPVGELSLSLLGPGDCCSGSCGISSCFGLSAGTVSGCMPTSSAGRSPISPGVMVSLLRAIFSKSCLCCGL